MRAKIQNAVKNLIMVDPYYGLFSRHFKFIENDQIGLAGVKYSGGRLCFVYNPKAVAQLNDSQLQTLIRHEVLHASLGHLEFTPKWDVVWNKAADLAINTHLKKSDVIEMNGVYPSEGSFAHLEPNRSMEYYESIIRKDDDGQGYEFDTHYDGEGDSLSSDNIQDIKDIIKSTAKECSEISSWGSIPAELQSVIKAYVFGRYDWRGHLSRLIKRTRSVDISFSRRKHNKRFGTMFPGVIREYRPRIAVAVDESGSVSEELWNKIVERLSSLSRYASFSYVPFDCQVHEEGIKSFKHKERFAIGRSRVGGTDFDAPTQWFNENRDKYDALFIATDGEACAPSVCAKKRMWLIPEGSNLAFDTSEEIVYIGE